MNELESKTWRSFATVTKNFLDNKGSGDYISLVENMLNNYHDVGVNMSIKVHFLDSHLNKFPVSCGEVSDEQGFLQYITIMKDRHQGRWDTKMINRLLLELEKRGKQNHSRQSVKRKSLPRMCSSFIG